MVLVAIECGLESILQEERGELSMGWRTEKRSQGSESQNVSEEEVFKRDSGWASVCALKSIVLFTSDRSQGRRNSGQSPGGGSSLLPQSKECISGPPSCMAPDAMSSLQALSLWEQQSCPRSVFFSIFSPKP